MNNLDKLTKEVKPNNFIEKNSENNLNIDDIIEFFLDNDVDNKSSLVAGRVYQKNKKNDIIETLFKLIEGEIKKSESKNNKDFKLKENNLNNLKSNNIKSDKSKKERFSDQIKTKLRDLKPLQ